MVTYAYTDDLLLPVALFTCTRDVKNKWDQSTMEAFNPQFKTPTNVTLAMIDLRPGSGIHSGEKIETKPSQQEWGRGRWQYWVSQWREKWSPGWRWMFVWPRCPGMRDLVESLMQVQPSGSPWSTVVSTWDHLALCWEGRQGGNTRVGSARGAEGDLFDAWVWSESSDSCRWWYQLRMEREEL